MTPEELSFVYKHASAYGLAGLLVAAVAYVIGRHAVGGYLAEKGKNLATREDVAHLTKIVEDVKAPYAQLQEELKARHQLRIAAIDRRLQAHQEAFKLWRELMGAVHSDNVGPVVLRCQDWWEDNCLYLEAEVREAFVQAYSAANVHHSYVQGRTAADIVQANWKDIRQFPEVLFKAIKLPPLSELEKKVLEGPDRSHSPPS